MPWVELLALFTPHAPVAKTGRPPFDLLMMLRIDCLQQWFGLSDMGAEEALFETSFYRDFVGLSGTQRIPDRVSILQVINAKLVALGLLLKAGTVVDDTLIAAPSSTKNKDGKREPEMHQTKKGNQRHFGMKAHIGVNAESGLVRSAIGTAANVNDVTQGQALLRGKETVVFADAGYQGAHKRAAKAHALGSVHRTSRKTQSQRPCQSKAPISGNQASVRLYQSSLQGTGQDHRTAGHAVCAVQHLDGQKHTCAEGSGMSTSESSQRDGN